MPITGFATEPTARLTARGATGAIVPLDAGFRLESLDGTPATTLAARLTVEPAFAFTVTGGGRRPRRAPVAGQAAPGRSRLPLRPRR